MSIGTWLRALLIADPAVSALVGDRVHALQLPRGGALPALKYQRISGERVRGLSGPHGQAHPRMQIDAYADSHAAAEAVADAVEAALDGYAGPAGAGRIDAASLENVRDLHEDELGTRAYRVVMDFFISHPTT